MNDTVMVSPFKQSAVLHQKYSLIIIIIKAYFTSMFSVSDNVGIIIIDFHLYAITFTL